MGVNIYIERPADFHEHPEWDSTRFGGDKEMHDHFADLLNVEKLADGFPYMDDRVWWRPANFAAFRERAGTAAWPERWLKAADILEGNPDYWFYFSW